MVDKTLYRATVEVYSVPSPTAAIAALRDHPAINAVSQHSSFDTAVEVVAFTEATSRAVGIGQLVGTIRGLLQHNDVEYGVDMPDGDELRLIMGQEATPEQREAFNGGE
jgi:hypothetical protein